MGAIVALLIANLPEIISVATDISAVVGAAKATGSAYAAIKKTYPRIADMVDQIGRALPIPDGMDFNTHRESLVQGLFGGSPFNGSVRHWLAANGAGAILQQPGIGDA